MRALSMLILSIVVTPALACASTRIAEPMMKPLELTSPEAAPKPLTVDHFQRDHVGAVSEDDIRAILAAPVYLEEGARVGIVPVSTGYGADPDLPLAQIPGDLSRALEDSGHFEIVSEVSTDWPSTSSISGLRELATRYRAEYLLLYRHRFIDRSHLNAWALGWVTVVGAFVLPHNTIETAGVVEATLFDVRSGTLLFTVFERIGRRSDENVWQNDRKRRELKQGLLETAAGALSKKVVDKVLDLVAARPAPAADKAVSRADAAQAF